MQLKPITAIVVLLLVVASLLIAGCTTTTTSSTSDAVTTLNKAFTAWNATIVTPFKQTTNQFGNVIYSGVVKDGQQKLTPYVHNITLEETKNRSQSIERFNATVAQAKSQGYAQIATGQEGRWAGAIYKNKLTGETSRTYNGVTILPYKYVSVVINEPGTTLLPYDSTIVFDHTNYIVSTDYQTIAT
jgi:hypothetical protein